MSRLADRLPASGGCNCGCIRYRLTREPVTAYICHCHLCQKRTGSAFSMSLVVPADAVDLTAGQPERTERPLPEGGRNVSAACPFCQSRLWTRREGAPTLNLRAGTLDDTSDIRPVAQIWTSSAQPWALVREEILSYAGQPDDAAPLRAAWRRANAEAGVPHS